MRATAPRRLHELIKTAFEYDKELQAVRTQLRDDFDVRATRRAISIERFWTLMTEHIDKLERLQLLISRQMSQQGQGGSLDSSDAAAELGVALRRAVALMATQARSHLPPICPRSPPARRAAEVPRGDDAGPRRAGRGGGGAPFGGAARRGAEGRSGAPLIAPDLRLSSAPPHTTA